VSWPTRAAAASLCTPPVLAWVEGLGLRIKKLADWPEAEWGGRLEEAVRTITRAAAASKGSQPVISLSPLCVHPQCLPVQGSGFRDWKSLESGLFRVWFGGCAPRKAATVEGLGLGLRTRVAGASLCTPPVIACVQWVRVQS